MYAGERVRREQLLKKPGTTFTVDTAAATIATYPPAARPGHDY
jgi:hypothetical protein